MKKLFTLGAALLAATANAQLLTEHFGYGNGNLGTTGSSGGWANSNSGVTTSSNSLDGATLGLAASSGNKVTTTTSSSSGSYNQFVTSGILTGSVYFSCLLRVNSSTGISSTGQPIVGFLRINSQSSYYADAYLRLNSSNVQIGVSKVRATNVWSAMPITLGAVYLVVGKYEFFSGSGNDRVSLWTNPTSLGGTEPTADLSINSGGDGNDSQGIARVVITGGAAADVDEIRAGATWASVTPTSGTPPPSPSSVPHITQALESGSDFVLRGTNGPANGSYDVLSTSSVALPVNQWDEIASDTFDATGNFSSTNPLSGAVQQFYRVRVSGSNAPATAPMITSQPQSRTNLAGDTATFTVVANGTFPLNYQWFLNSTAISSATSATLTLNNVQITNEGSYFVIITNVVGSVTSTVATLTVSNIMLPPSITTQPQNQTATEGQTANFSVTATGTSPLCYQWFFNTNTPLANQTNAGLTLNNVSTNDAGGYFVIVTNNLGAATSVVSVLTVNPPSTNNVDFSHIGFGNNGFAITGGAAGPTVYVGSESELQAFADVNPPYTIYITNSFSLSGMSTHIRPNKTVIGLGNVVLSGGGLYLYRSTNVIIRNLTMHDSTEDNIGLHYSANVWIDHCTLYNSSDGNVDLTQESDNITISWCRFYYTVNNGHNFVNLLGASDGETGSIGKLRVTFHHNWWDAGCVERLPSVRFGRAHVFNNYYNAPGNNYCVRSRLYAECRVENNAFENVKNPWEVYITSGPAGLIYASGNSLSNVTWTTMYPATDGVFTPPYSYTLDAAAAVPGAVTQNAGAGKGPFAP